MLLAVDHWVMMHLESSESTQETRVALSCISSNCCTFLFSSTSHVHHDLMMHNKAWIDCEVLWHLNTINNQLKGPVGKGHWVFLVKSELCPKHYKFCRRFCLGLLNNVLFFCLFVFLCWNLLHFQDITCVKKCIVVVTSACNHKDVFTLFQALS